jgi:WD40 repeat protein
MKSEYNTLEFDYDRIREIKLKMNKEKQEKNLSVEKNEDKVSSQKNPTEEVLIRSQNINSYIKGLECILVKNVPVQLMDVSPFGDIATYDVSTGINIYEMKNIDENSKPIITIKNTSLILGLTKVFEDISFFDVKTLGIQNNDDLIIYGLKFGDKKYKKVFERNMFMTLYSHNSVKKISLGKSNCVYFERNELKLCYDYLNKKSSSLIKYDSKVGVLNSLYYNEEKSFIAISSTGVQKPKSKISFYNINHKLQKIEESMSFENLNNISDIHLDSDLEHVAVASNDNFNIYKIDYTNKKLDYICGESLHSEVNSVRFAPSNKYVICSTEDEKLRIFEIKK